MTTAPNHFFSQPVSDPEIRAHLHAQNQLQLHELLTRYKVPHNLEQTGGNIYAITCVRGDQIFIATGVGEDDYELYVDTVESWQGEEQHDPLVWCKNLSAADLVRSLDSAVAGKRDVLPAGAELFPEAKSLCLMSEPTEFALALSKATGWPVVAVTDQTTPAMYMSIAHAGVRTPRGTVLDASGEWTDDQWIADWRHELEGLYLDDPDLPDSPGVFVKEVTDLEAIGLSADSTPSQRMSEIAQALLQIHHDVAQPPPTSRQAASSSAVRPQLAQVEGPGQ